MAKMNVLSGQNGAASQPLIFQSQVQAALPGSARLPQDELADDRLFIPDRLSLVPTRRLVVLVPDGDFDTRALARRVWQLAASSGLNVLFLGLTLQAHQTAAQRRRLVELAALSADRQVRTDLRLRPEQTWHQALRQVLEPGDLPVCLAGDRLSGFWPRSGLGERLAAGLHLAVYELGGLKVTPASAFPDWIRSVAAWTLALAWIAFFFWLQVGIDRGLAGPQATILLCMSVVAEIYGIWKINEWIG